LSSVTTTLSGVSALAEPDQPTSKVMLVWSPSADLMSSRCLPHPTLAAIFAGASAAMSTEPSAMRFECRRFAFP
jgi:hypothetical protein